MNEIIRNTVIRKNQICAICGKELLKGSTVLVKTFVVKRTMKRLYYCLECNKQDRIDLIR